MLKEFLEVPKIIIDQSCLLSHNGFNGKHEQNLQVCAEEKEAVWLFKQSLNIFINESNLYIIAIIIIQN